MTSASPYKMVKLWALGPNGAGKSTTMNMLTGYISSSSGEALINDINILDNPIQAKREIGYLPELPPLYQEMTVMGYLRFVYDLKKCKLPAKHTSLKSATSAKSVMCKTASSRICPKVTGSVSVWHRHSLAIRQS